MTSPWPPIQDSPIRVAISDHFQVDGITVTMGVRFDQGHAQILHFTEEGYITREMLEGVGIAAEHPTMTIPHDFARALLDALLRYYQGASDMHTVRSDLLHERGRVDNLIRVVSELATRPQNIHVHKAEE